MTTVDTLKRLLAERILVLDGAMGTMVQRHKLTEADFRGERFKNHPKDLKGNNDVLVLTRPDVIAGIHAEYLAAGADIIETNTFSGTSVSQGDYGLEAVAYEMNFEATKLAKRVAAEWTAKTPDKPRFVAGSIGPTTKTLSISPDVNNPAFRAITFDEMRDAFKDQARGLIDGGSDLLLVETQIDTLNAKAALVAIAEVFEEKGVTAAGDGVGDADRSQRPHAVGPDARCVLSVDRARQAVQRRPQLRARRPRNAPVSRRAVARGRGIRQLLSQRRTAECVRAVRRAAGGDRRPDQGVRGERLRQHHRRLLWNHAGPYSRDCAGGRRA